MDLQGKVIAVLPAREGTSARGPWKSQEYVIETHDQYPKKMVFNIFGAVSFDIDAHEYNGRWFNNVRAWNIQRVDAAAVQAGVPPVAAAPGQQAAPSSATAQTAPFPPAQPAEDSTDDLPF